MINDKSIKIRTDFLLKKINQKFNGDFFEKKISCFEAPKNKNVLILAPHPDDEVIGCGGLIQQMVENDCCVTVLVVTNENDRSIVKPKIIDGENIRMHEARKACAVLGYQNLLFWSFPERGLEAEQQKNLANGITLYIENNDFDLIFMPNNYDMHPDHRSVYEAGMESIYKLKLEIPIFLYEIWGPCYATHYLFLSENEIQKKIESMKCYQSQIDSVDYLKIMEKINELRRVGLEKRSIYNDRTHVECFQLLSPTQ